MKVFKRNIIILMFIGLLGAASISYNDASKVVQNTIQRFSPDVLQIKEIETVTSSEGKNLFYIFHLEPNGFVLISADNRATPLLGYSFENNFKLEGAPSNINWLIDSYKNQILNLINSNISPDAETNQEWKSFLSNESFESETRDVNPLVDAEFDQSGAWNNTLTSETGFNGPLGCVAVSMAQIMHYWGYPEQGESSNSYLEDDLGTLEVDFSQTFYDFNNMAATYASNPSRLLLYHAGVAVNMDYDYGGSGAMTGGVYPSAEYAFENFFKYNGEIYEIDKVNYTDTEFRNILKNELDYNRPILQSGCNNNYNGCHAWNIDGYQGNNLHCNWGWGGSNNGYFNLSSMGGFPSYQSAMINILPESLLNPLALFEFEINENIVTFIDLSEIINEPNSIEYWSWDYGNGVTETDAIGFNEYTYSQAGEYEVSLIVTNIYGQESDPHIETITIGNALIGDINEDTILNVLDIVILVSLVIGSDPPTSSELNAGDLNGDGTLNVLDIVSLVNLVLLG